MKIKTIVLMIAVAALLVAPAVSTQDTVSSASVVVDEDSLLNNEAAKNTFTINGGATVTGNLVNNW